MSKTWAILPRQASDNLLRECGYEVKDMTEQTDELADRIKAALSGEIKLTGKACPHGYDLAVCPSRECKNPYAVETLLEEAETALRASGHGAGREAAIEECAREAERLSEKDGWSPGYSKAAKVVAKTIRTLKTATPAALERTAGRWQAIETAPKDGTTIMLTGIAGNRRWFMDGQIYALGWIGGSAVGRQPDYWQPTPDSFALPVAPSPDDQPEKQV